MIGCLLLAAASFGFAQSGSLTSEADTIPDAVNQNQSGPTPGQAVTVLLRNGKIVQGTMALSPFDGFLTLDLDTFSQTHIPYKKIDQVFFGTYTKAEVAELKSSIRYEAVRERVPLPFNIHEKGLYGAIDFGIITAGSDYVSGSAGYMLHTRAGYTFCPLLSVGVGVGIDNYGYASPRVVPLYASVRGVIGKKRWTPYYSLDVGGGIAWMNNNEWGRDIQYQRSQGGFMMQAGLGYQWNLEKTSIQMGLNYKTQQTSFAYSFTDDWQGTTFEVDEKRRLSRIGIVFGFTF